MDGKKYSFDATGAPVLISELLKRAGARLGMPCGGRGSCGKCTVFVTGAVEPPSPKELQLLSPALAAQGMRLACMAKACGSVTVTVPHEQYSNPFSSDNNTSTQPAAGFAVDIGTTTVCAASYAKGGEKLASLTSLNPQRAYGADVISRIEHSLKGDAAALSDSVLQCIRQLLKSLGYRKGDKVVITGNTAMLYLLTGRSPLSLSRAPFEADCLFGQYFTDEEFTAYLPRCISAFLGADTVCAVLYADVRHGFCSGGARLLADIGTNGEIVLHTGGGILACSTAAGPAFEGAALYCGSLAVQGAVERVRFNGVSFECDVIGGGTGATVCGSGAVSAVEAMLKAGVLDPNGSMNTASHRFSSYMTQINGEDAFILPGTKAVITNADIRNLQLAKSAVCAGILTLAGEAGLRAEDTEQLYVAGAFGRSLNMHSAEYIGLIPRGLAGKSTYISNAALEGAAMLLFNTGADEQIAQRTHCVELSDSERFFDAYINGMILGQQ